jgi:hypothetical protein
VATFGYSKLLLMAIGGHFTINYCWILVVILLMAIGSYSIDGY